MSDLLKMLVVDDEYLVRELLKNSIDWYDLGIEIVAEASSGLEALDLVKEVRPDIIFVDICMPFMNGIEFSRKISEEGETAKIVILTGHEEFEYAQESVKIGVSDFLLKPVNVNEILRVIDKIKKEIEAERDFQNEFLSMKNQLKEHMSHLKELFLKDLLLGSVEKEVINEKMNYFSIEAEDGEFQVAAVKAENSSGRNLSEEERLIYKLRWFEVVEGILAEYKGVLPLWDNDDTLILISLRGSLNISELGEEIKRRLIKECRATVSIGIGLVHQGAQFISLSYREALSALKYRVLEGRDIVIDYRDIKGDHEDLSLYNNDLIEKYRMYLKAGVEDLACDYIDELLDSRLFGPSAGIDTIRVVSSSIISVILNVLNDLNIEVTEVFSYGGEPYENMFKIDTLPDIKSFLTELTVRVSQVIKKINSSKTKKMITELEEIVNKNLADRSLTLNTVAEHFGMNPSYFSRKFKKDIGCTFIEFVSRIRINRALELLQNTDLKNYEIAEKVGVEDPHYFSTFFKKHMKISISEYRKSLSKS